MKRKISALLLTVLLAMTIACDAFAWNYNLEGTGITPPARFKSIEKTKDGLECKYSGAGTREFLMYMPVGRVSEAELRKVTSDLQRAQEIEGLGIVQQMKKIKCGGGRKVWYFFFSGYNDAYIYGYAAIVPCGSGEYMVAIDMLGTAKEAGAFPFSKKDIRRIAATIEG